MTADTSVVIAALSSWHEQHERCAELAGPVRALPAHVMLESYAVLTRMPAGYAISPAAAAGLLRERFPEAPLQLGARDRRVLLSTLADAALGGASSYDGLVALEARAAGETLLTCDARAERTYRALDAAHRAVA